MRYSGGRMDGKRASARDVKVNDKAARWAEASERRSRWGTLNRFEIRRHKLPSNAHHASRWSLYNGYFVLLLVNNIAATART